jgi:serine/threonine-protein kinase
MDREQLLDQVITAYLKDVEAGRQPDRDAWLARYPDLSEELLEFLASMGSLDRVAAPLRQQLPVTPRNGRGTDTLAYGEPLATDPPSETQPPLGDYELFGEIARGGMGVVFKARQVSLNRIVALKMILAGQLASAADVRRFRQEAEAAANLDHPNILPVYEVGEHQGHQYFAMRLIEGGSLAQHLDRFRNAPRMAAALVEQLARAVHHAHQHGILHRDLKPANVLLEWRDGQPQPFLTDFGLAKRLEGAGAMTQSGAIVGTPEYMAPEQARGHKGLTTAVDIYALGGILYALLTGRSPFQGDNVMQTLRDVLDTMPASPVSLNPIVPRDLAVV